MAETVEELKARDKAVEGVLREIYAAITDWIPPDSELGDGDHRPLQDHGLKFVADDAFGASCNDPVRREQYLDLAKSVTELADALQGRPSELK